MIVIGLGGNIGSEDAIRERFGRARLAIMELGFVRSAALYRTAPIGPAQSAFLNTAVSLVAVDMLPDELIAALLEIERLAGRDRRSEERWGPRAIDLDVLVWGDRRIARPDLEVPHPRLAERRFALAPLADLVGREFVIPDVGPVGAALAAVRSQWVEQIAETW